MEIAIDKNELKYITNSKGEPSGLVIEFNDPNYKGIFRNGLTDLQKELLKIYSLNINDESLLNEIRMQISKLLFQKFKKRISTEWTEKEYSEETIKAWEHGE